MDIDGWDFVTTIFIVFYQLNLTSEVHLAEWLRRCPAKALSSGCEGSSPSVDGFFEIVLCFETEDIASAATCQILAINTMREDLSAAPTQEKGQM